MDVTDANCNECGASDWTQVLTTEYPERRRDRERTVRHVYECNECNAEGRFFEYNDGNGTPTLSGAMR